MKTKILILQHVFSKYLFHRHLLEKHNAENLQDFAQIQLDLEFSLDNSYQDINADGNPDLGLHSILGDPKKCLDSQVLLDPLEEDFYLPAALVKLSNCQSWQ